MFTWICPKCGGEVPPSYSECPRCSPTTTANATELPRAVAPNAASPATASPTSQPAEVSHLEPVKPPPRADPSPPATAAASVLLPGSVARTPGPRSRLSPALVAIGAAAGMVVLLGVLYLYVLPDRSHATNTTPASLQNPGPAGSAQASHPLAKHLEIAGIRVTEPAAQTAKVSFLIINHSAADLPDLKLQIMLRTAPDANNVFDFPVDLPSLGPYESREITSTVKTTLKPYELPDWQMLRADFRVTSQP